MILCPPVIADGLSVCSTHVRLRGQLRGATVRAFVDGAVTPVMEAVAEWADEWYRLVGVTLTPGAVVRAEQSLNGFTSVRSTEGVAVQAGSFTQPVFEAPLVGCGQIAVIGGLAPGAKVTISSAASTNVAEVSSPGSRLVIDLKRPAGSPADWFVAPGDILRATSSSCGVPGGPTVLSTPAEQMVRSPGFKLEPVVLDQALRCQRVLHFRNTRPGAVLKLARGTSTSSWTCSGNELFGRIDPPLADGEVLRYWQEPRPDTPCKVLRSDVVTTTVSADPPPPPLITTRPCPGTRWLRLSGLVPSATVKLFTEALAELCVFEAAETSQEIDLGTISLEPGRRLQAAQGLCGQFGLPSPVPSWVTAPVASGGLRVPGPVVECGVVVRVEGLAGATRVAILSERMKGRIGFGFSEDGGNIDVPVSPPLMRDDRITVVASGCSNSTTTAVVESAGNLSTTEIASPPLDGDTSVALRGLTPGCRVDITVDGFWAGGTATGATVARVGLVRPLRHESQVQVTVRLCSRVLTKPPVTVTLPPPVRWIRPTSRALQTNRGHFFSGRVTAVHPLGERLLVGTEKAGLWLVPRGGAASPLSLDWASPNILSLTKEPRPPADEASGKLHLYCGTSNGLRETDYTAAAPLLAWKTVSGLGAPGGPGLTVNDMLVIRSRVFIATERGVWHAQIPPAPGGTHAWVSDPVINTAPILSLAEGPNSSVIAYGPRNGSNGGFIVGTWAGFSGLRWTNTTPSQASVVDPRVGTVVRYMANGRLASAPGDRARIYAALADGRDATWLAVMRSDDGGMTWAIPYDDPDLRFFKPVGGRIDFGFQADRNLGVVVHPRDRDRVLLVGRYGGLLGSRNGGGRWDVADWPPITNGSFHADSLCIESEPTDPSGDTIVVGSDGGVFVSRDFGKTWDTSFNETLTTLMFDQEGWSSAPALSTSAAFPGLVVGAFQDNGKAYLTGDGEPWRELERVGDGQRALFVTGDVVLNGGNDMAGEIKWARWNGTEFVDITTIAVPHPPGTQWMPFLGRVVFPSYRDPVTNALMVAVAGDNRRTGDVFGLFDRGQGHSPVATRMYWARLGTLPSQVTGIGSLTGRLVLAGTSEARGFLLDPATGVIVEMRLPLGLPASVMRWICPGGGTLGFALVGDWLLRTDDYAVWRRVATPVGADVSNVIALDHGSDPPRLILGGNEGIWISRDLGDSWEATAGMPARPIVNHLEVTQLVNGSRVAHAGTWNWSVWRARIG